MAKGQKTKKSITEADRAAAMRLKNIWLAMPNRPTQAALAEAWPYRDREANQSLISQYMNAKIALNHRAVLFFAQQLGVDPTAIRSDLPEQLAQTNNQLQPDDWTDVTAYGQQVAAGDGMTPEEYAETKSLKFKRSSLRRKGLHPHKLSIFYAKGDSMEPRIHDGDALLIDTDDTRPRDGCIYVVKYDGGFLVKRLHLYGNSWFLVSDNGSDPKWRKPIPIDHTNDFEVIGRVRWIGSWED